MPKKSDAQHAADLDRLSPAARDAKIGTVLTDLIATVNALVADNVALRAKYATLLTKLDSDAGVTDTNYTATQAPAAANAVAVPLLSTRS